MLVSLPMTRTVLIIDMSLREDYAVRPHKVFLRRLARVA